MKKLNLANFKLKMASDDSNKQALLDKLAGVTQATCHDLICCIAQPGDGGSTAAMAFGGGGGLSSITMG